MTAAAHAVDTLNWAALPNGTSVLNAPYTTPAATAGLNGTTVTIQTVPTGTFDTLSAAAGNLNVYGTTANPVAQISSANSLITGVPDLDVVMNPTNNDGSANLLTTFTFSRPVTNLTFTIYDIDGGPTCTNCQFNDIVDVNSSAGIPAVALAGNLAFNAATGRITTTANANGNATDNATVTVAGPVTWVTVRHIAGAITNATAQSIGPAQQGIGIGNMTWGGKVAVQKISQGGTGTFSFAAPTNLASAPAAITTTAANTATPATPTAIRFTSSDTATTIPENAVAGFTPTGLACTDANSAANGNTGTFGAITGGVPTIAAANVKPSSNITCQITNTRATVSVQVQTVGGPGGPFVFPTFANLTSQPGGAGGITTTTGSPTPTTPVPIPVTTVGTKVDLAETVATGYILGSVTCTDANAAITSNPVLTFNTAAFTIPAANIKTGTAYNCVVVNIKSPVLSLTKFLSASRIAAADQFVLTPTGPGVPAAVTTSGTGSTIVNASLSIPNATIGSTYTMTESMAPGSTSVLSQYSQTVSCTNSWSSGTNVSGITSLPITITPVAGDTIACNLTNTPKSTTLQLVKAWGANSNPSDVASIGATSGGASNTTAFTANGGTGNSSGTPVNVAVGNTITFPAETFSVGTLANYTTTLACTTNLGATANSLSGTNGQVANTLVIGANDGGKAITCTYTNTRKSTAFQIAKAWDSGSTAGDVANIAATTGLINNTAALASTAKTNAAGPTVTVYAGETATLPAETMSVGTLSSYLTALSCNAGTLSGTAGQSSNTLAITAAAIATNPIICTYTNTKVVNNLAIVKTASPAGPFAVGQVVTYTYAVTNTGNVPMYNVQVSDMHGTPAALVPLGAGGITNETIQSGGSGNSTDATSNNGIWSVLAPGDTVNFTYSYTVTQADIDHG